MSGLSTASVARAAVFGGAFGFLLQKGGVAKFDVLVGVLLLEDFVVVQVMLSAIATAMVGILALERLGWTAPRPQETVYGRAVVGGLVFGAGFGLIAYCPGTNAAALGQGNLDALAGAAGMVVGSYLFALRPGVADARAIGWGRRGALTLPELWGVRRGAFVAAAAALLVLVLALLHQVR